MRIFCTPLQPKVKVGPRWGFEPGDQDPRFYKHSNYALRLVGTCDLCWKPAWWRWGREGRAWCLSGVPESLLSEGGHVGSSVVLLPSLPSFLRKRRAPAPSGDTCPPPRYFPGQLTVTHTSCRFLPIPKDSRGPFVPLLGSRALWRVARGDCPGLGCAVG